MGMFWVAKIKEQATNARHAKREMILFIFQIFMIFGITSQYLANIGNL